jgi:hypothetical protein
MSTRMLRGVRIIGLDLVPAVAEGLLFDDFTGRVPVNSAYVVPVGAAGSRVGFPQAYRRNKEVIHRR